MNGFLVMLSIAIMAGIAYLAISKKSIYKIRVAALGALALMVISVIIGMIVFFKKAEAPKQLILPDMLPSDMPPPQPDNNPVTMIMLGVFLVGLFVCVFLLAMREQKRAEGKEEPPANDW